MVKLLNIPISPLFLNPEYLFCFGSRQPASLWRHDGERTGRFIDQHQKADQVDLAAGDLQVIVHQRVLHAGGTGHHLDEDLLGQCQGRVGIGRRLCLLVVQHRIFYPEHEGFLGIGEYEINLEIHILRGWAVETCGHGVKETFDRRLH